MEVDYEISKDKEDGSSAHIKPKDLLNGDYIIYLGSDVKFQELCFSKKSVIDKKILKFNSFSQHLEHYAEILLTHEFIHILLWVLDGDINTVRSLDNIDVYDEISGCGLL